MKIDYLLICFATLVAVGTALATDSEVLSLLKRVIGGDVIERGKWPWLGSLTGTIPTKKVFGITTESRKLYCGASLIKSNWALSAAHCFPTNSDSMPSSQILNPANWRVRLGHKGHQASVWAKMKDKVGKTLSVESLRDWNVKVTKIFIHPHYNAEEMWSNDIVLLQLAESIPDDLKERIRPVDLPIPNDSSFPADHQDCFFQGWGCTESGGGVADKGKEVTLPKVSDTVCSNLWGGISTGGRLCAGYDLAAKGICPGDSGGPLVCQREDNYVQVGIASFTSRNHPDQVPGAFTRVSAYVNWIEETIRNN